MLWLLSGPLVFTCWILLLRYSVLFTVESLTLLYLLIISWFIYVFWKWCIDNLGAFHGNQTSMCLDPRLNLGWGWRRETGLSPPVKYFYWPFQGGTSFVDHLCFLCFVFLMLLRLFIAALWWTCWEWADLLALVGDIDCILLLSHVVSWIRCGIYCIVSWSLPPF